ncbi:MAG TPA: hypothetical protein VN454_07490 [Candidatus Angelobacter sp.]|nr:hypothetical protein [Candidatus Angelobacter sp.]
MNRTVICMAAFGSLLIPSYTRSQVVDATPCEILSNPQSFDGKIVRVKGVAVAGFDEFAIQDASCKQAVNAIWLAYPEGTKGKAGPAASMRLQLAKNSPAVAENSSRTPVMLNKNKDFKDFDKFLSTQAKTDGLCPGCVKYSVAGTFVGRLDGAKDVGLLRDAGGKVMGIGGFGNLNRYTARLVLQSVAEISPQEIDYAKGGVAAPDSTPGSGSFVPESPMRDQLKRASDAYGAPGEQNGVLVGFGVPNEIRKDDSTKSTSANSPDGILYDAMFDSDRLKGPALEVAMSHMGAHISDLRSTSAAIQGASLYGFEFRAWQTSAVSALASKTKALVLPGGYVIFSQSWSNPELVKNINGGVASFLANWAGISNPPKP